jgi:hypothetical protein
MQGPGKDLFSCLRRLHRNTSKLQRTEEMIFDASS